MNDLRRDRVRIRRRDFRSATAEKAGGYQCAMNYVGLDFHFGKYLK